MGETTTSRRCALVSLAAFVAICFCSGTTDGAIAGVDNVITRWNSLAQRIVRTTGIPNQIATRVYSLVHLSQYQALQIADKKRVAHPEAAAAYAGHYVLSEIFPWQQSPIFDGAIASDIYPLKLSEREDALVQKIGISVAVKLLKWRVYDGSQQWAKFQPSRSGGPTGDYQFTPNQTFALYPQLSRTRPYLVRSLEDFDTFGGPPHIPSDKYDSDYEVLATIGNVNSPLQTQSYKDTAKFWEDGSNTSQISGHYYNISLAIAGPQISLRDTAKLFALLGVAQYDASIVGWYQKYKYLFWRPITALRQGDPSHAPLPSFNTFLRTPPHPEYPSGHSLIAGSSGSILSKFLGISISDTVPNGTFAVETEGYLLPTRTFSTLEQAINETYDSRIYGGVHFPKAAVDGTEVGYNVGYYVYEHFKEIAHSL